LAFRIEPLGAHHDRGAFCCGNQIIDRFCREQALKDHDKYRVRVFVACEEGSQAVVGFYSLCTSTLAARTFPGFGSRMIPAVYLAMVGVAEGRQGQGLGTALMTDALVRTLNIAENAGAYCLWLNAVDQETAEFYEGLEFSRMTDGGLEMYIAIPTIADALADPDTDPMASLIEPAPTD